MSRRQGGGQIRLEGIKGKVSLMNSAEDLESQATNNWGKSKNYLSGTQQQSLHAQAPVATFLTTLPSFAHLLFSLLFPERGRLVEPVGSFICSCLCLEQVSHFMHSQLILTIQVLPKMLSFSILSKPASAVPFLHVSSSFYLLHGLSHSPKLSSLGKLLPQ